MFNVQSGPMGQQPQGGFMGPQARFGAGGPQPSTGIPNQFAGSGPTPYGSQGNIQSAMGMGNHGGLASLRQPMPPQAMGGMTPQMPPQAMGRPGQQGQSPQLGIPPHIMANLANRGGGASQYAPMGGGIPDFANGGAGMNPGAMMLMQQNMARQGPQGPGPQGFPSQARGPGPMSLPPQANARAQSNMAGNFPSPPQGAMPQQSMAGGNAAFGGPPAARFR